ncbi:putative transporter [Trypanosoma rangeli]|uniref:Putative transporter n=1 Tax=Trypanosoma rangeli TaxID=5698 RepID=A0A422ND25_TRYRA|nr:putative transporter [Trypanosoma rangeli]RNF03404.1 putative transporter [Trypanosoma rangeli]|eukprot:RNF03404.1 putative transporter [Trypanosoma rangeli]
MFEVTVLAVAKVIVAVCIGAATSRQIPNASVTIRDFTFVIANILLPCLTFHNTASAVNVEVLIRCSVLFLFSLTAIGTGLLCGLVASKLMFRVSRTGIPKELQHSLRYLLTYRDAEGNNVHLGARHGSNRGHQTPLRPVVCVLVSGTLETQKVEPEELLPLLEPPGVEYEEQPFYHYAALIACGLQNSVTLPLSLLQTMAESLAWIDLALGTSYIFIYSLVVSISVWGLGPAFVDRGKKETGKRRMIRELLELHKKLQHCCDAATQTEVHETLSLLVFPGVMTVAPLPSSDWPGALQPSTAAESAARNNVAYEDGVDDEAAVLTVVAARRSGEQADVPPRPGRWFLAATPATCETFRYNWRERDFVRVVYLSDFKDEVETERQKGNALVDFGRSCKKVSLRLLQTLAFTSVVAGFIVAVTPPLRWLFFEGPLSMVMDSIGLVAQGSIPSSLLLLGTNLAGTSHTMTAAPEVRLREAEQNTAFPLADVSVDPTYAAAYNELHEAIEFDEHASFALKTLQQYEPVAVPMATAYEGPAAATASVPSSGVLRSLRRACALHGVRKGFVFGITFIRLLVVPAVGFAMVLLTQKAFPSLFGEQRRNNVLLLVLLGELAAPSALNATILFNARQYMPGAWSKMLFFQYITCALTFMLWCTLALWVAT